MSALEIYNETVVDLLNHSSGILRLLDDHEVNYDAFRYIQYILQTKPVLIKVGPTLALSRNNVLQWQLKGLELERESETAATPTSLKQAMEEELKELVHNSEEKKSSENKELAVFYAEGPSEPADLTGPARKKLQTALFSEPKPTTTKHYLCLQHRSGMIL